MKRNSDPRLKLAPLDGNANEQYGCDATDDPKEQLGAFARIQQQLYDIHPSNLRAIVVAVNMVDDDGNDCWIDIAGAEQDIQKTLLSLSKALVLYIKSVTELREKNAGRT